MRENQAALYCREINMNDKNGYDDFASAPGVPGAPPAPYQFSQDELRVLQECNTDSFFRRSLPLGTAFGLTAYFGVQKGIFKPNPRFGATPKVTLAVIVGYFLGKLSYQQACAEKLMALPNSYIGHLLREKKQPTYRINPHYTPPMFGARSEDIYSDAGPGSSLDLDTDRPLFGDDTYRPGSDSSPRARLEKGPSKANLSYEDLRRLNRGETLGAPRPDPYKVEPTVVPPVSKDDPAPTRSTPTNKYGDTVD